MAAFDNDDIDFLEDEDVESAAAGLSLGDNLNLNVSMESNGSSSSSSTASTSSTAPAFHSSGNNNCTSSSGLSNATINEWLRNDGDMSVDQLNMLIEACGNFKFEHRHQLEAVEARLEIEKKRLEDSFELDMYNPRRDDLDIQNYVQIEQLLKILKNNKESIAIDSARTTFAAWDSQSSPPPARSPKKNIIEDARHRFEAWRKSSSPPPKISLSPQKSPEHIRYDAAVDATEDANDSDNGDGDDCDASMFFFVPLAEERKVERPSKLISKRSYIAPPLGNLHSQKAANKAAVSSPMHRDLDVISGDISPENNQDKEKEKKTRRKKIKGEAKWDRLMRGMPARKYKSLYEVDNEQSVKTPRLRIPKLEIMPAFK